MDVEYRVKLYLLLVLLFSAHVRFVWSSFSCPFSITQDATLITLNFCLSDTDIKYISSVCFCMYLSMITLVFCYIVTAQNLFGYHVLVIPLQVNISKYVWQQALKYLPSCVLSHHLWLSLSWTLQNTGSNAKQTLPCSRFACIAATTELFHPVKHSV